MSRILWFLCFPICFLAAPGALFAQEGISLEACDRLLGAGYDSLPTSARHARLVEYGNCWRRLATNLINRNYSDIVRKVNGYKTNARRVVRGEIDGKAATERLLVQTEQRAERGEADQRYEEESRAIQISTTAENRPEMRARAQELLVETRVANAEMLERHQSDVLELEAQIRTAYLTADNELDRIVDADLVSLRDQQQEKLSYIGEMFDRFLNAAPGQSIADEESVESRESTLFQVMQSLFIYYSGLVGEREPNVQINIEYGSVGIRG